MGVVRFEFAAKRETPADGEWTRIGKSEDDTCGSGSERRRSEIHSDNFRAVTRRSFVDFGVPSMGGCKEGERLTDREPMEEAVERE